MLISGMTGSFPEVVYAQDDSTSTVTSTDDENTENVEDTENIAEANSVENTENTETSEENDERGISTFSNVEEIEVSSNEYAEGTVAVIGDKEYQSLSEAIKAVSENTEATIMIVDDITLSSTVGIYNNKKIILKTDNDSHTITFSGLNSSNNGFYIVDSSLTIDGNLTITTSDTAFRALVDLYGGKFYLVNGTLSSNEADFSRGIVTLAKDSVFTVSGGTIQGNRNKESTGVYVQDWIDNGGTKTVTFNMIGGTIKDCHSSSIGGAIHVNDDKAVNINLTGGRIDNCSTDSNGGAISMATGQLVIGDVSISNCSAARGGAVRLNKGAEMTMTDGIISACTATKVVLFTRIISPHLS